MVRKLLRGPAWLAVMLMAVTPAQAQFGSLLRSVKPPSAKKQNSDDSGGCPQGKKGSRAGRNILGGVLGNVLGDVAGKTGFGSYIPTSEVAGTLTDAIACRLDPAEQLQAASATEEVTRGEAVGSTANWTSETREGVSGTSTVVARNDESDGRRCMSVNDVIIVGGEETMVAKRMCKEPGESRYVLAA